MSRASETAIVQRGTDVKIFHPFPREDSHAMQQDLGFGPSGPFLGELSGMAAGAQQAATPPEPDPMKVIQQMCDTLKSLNRFSFRTEEHEILYLIQETTDQHCRNRRLGLYFCTI